MNHKLETDERYNGYRYVVVAQPSGHRCGYVGVEPDHPLHGKDDPNVVIHGGITYSDQSADYPVESDGLWWIGFDCSHAGDGKDLSIMEPKMVDFYKKYPEFMRSGEVARSNEYVQKECKSLINQIIKLQEVVI